MAKVTVEIHLAVGDEEYFGSSLWTGQVEYGRQPSLTGAEKRRIKTAIQRAKRKHPKLAVGAIVAMPGGSGWKYEGATAPC